MEQFFIITVDVEGDNIWSRPAIAETKNSKFIPRFQSLAEKYSFKVSYLSSYEMIQNDYYTCFARDVISTRTAEIGGHLHAWDTPPIAEGYGDGNHHSYMFEIPGDILEQKIQTLTNAIRDKINVNPVSHRAGRWGLNANVAKLLYRNGYIIDCSVTPNVSWTDYPGLKSGGTDYRSFPEHAYFMDLNDISKATNEGLLEVPVTIINSSPPTEGLLNSIPSVFLKRVVRKLAGGNPVKWLRPNGKNLESMLRIVDEKKESKSEYIEFMIHSSELMPGGSPTFKDASSIEKLYVDIEALFKYLVNSKFKGSTLSEFYEHKTP